MATNPIRQMLLEELDLLVRTTHRLIDQIEEDDWSFRPHESMRTLQELATHLVQIPATDLAILQENDEIAIRKLEKNLTPKTREDYHRILTKGFAELTAYMDSLSEDFFIHRKTRAYYNQQPVTQAKWLIEIITHMAHHRAQLFNYLKELKRDVTMYSLY
ncbi:DinB family protein [Thermoactinomyces daqus]|nr:DinB family protein [Thermoactinomyces daqus]